MPLVLASKTFGLLWSQQPTSCFKSIVNMSCSEDHLNEYQEPLVGNKMTEEEIVKSLLSSSSVRLEDLIPSGPLRSIDAARVATWILCQHAQKRNSMRIMQRIKWLTAVVQYGIVDSLTDLGKLFNPLLQLVFISKYQASICHLLYMIATPNLYQFQIERIMKNANIVGLTKPLAGLLGRLKSLRPDLVPQTVPYQTNTISFPKAPVSMCAGLFALSERIKENAENTNQITFSINSEQKRATKKMRLEIIPRVQHIYLESSSEVDFQKIVPLSQLHRFQDILSKITTVRLPNHIGSLLNKREHHYVLFLRFTPHVDGQLSQWLYLTLRYEFIEKPQSQGREGKTLLLDRIKEFQECTGRKLLAVYNFLSEYLRIWDGIQFSDQILQLLTQITFLPYSDLYNNFLRILEDLFHSCHTPYRLKIIDFCQKLIQNLLIEKFGRAARAKAVFYKSNEAAPEEEIEKLVEGVYVVSEVIRFAERLLNTALMSSTDLSLVLRSLIDVECEFEMPFRTFCQPVTVYSALFSTSPVLVALLCQLLCKYNTLGLKPLMNLSTFPELEDFRRDSLDNASMLNRYIIDVSSCLVYQKAFVSDTNSLLSLTPRSSVKKLSKLGSYKAAFDLKRHPAFMGIAREWIKSKPGYSANAPTEFETYEQIEADSESYIRYLFSYFPTIREYIQEFHRA
ncbi:Centromere protein I [Daphnia magna]|uniref:Centromere protein I n=1 Tax=Daphnia magna TaxID=35525 RepID=A0A164LBC8_9CRUS|nr:Centromere protein I [Daphnia magna]